MNRTYPPLLLRPLPSFLSKSRLLRSRLPPKLLLFLVFPPAKKLFFRCANSTFKIVPLNSLPLNQLIAELAVGGSSYVIVTSPFGLPVSLSLYTQIFGLRVFLSIYRRDENQLNLI